MWEPVKYDAGAGWLRRRRRCYDGCSGQFTQEDPIGLGGGSNLYGYAGGDPINNHDPFGLACERIAGTTAPCELFAAIWAESRGASAAAQEGMAMVLKNRVDRGFRGAKSYRDAVWQRKQFSFTNKDPREAGNMRAYNSVMAGRESSSRFDEFAQRIENVYTGATPDATDGATFYYSPRGQKDTPKWTTDGTKIHTMQVNDEFSAYKCKNGKANC